MNDCAGYSRENQRKQTVAQHTYALEERHAATKQFGIHGHHRSATPRDDEDGAEHQAALVRGGEGGVEFVCGRALARQEDGESEAEDERPPQVPVLQLCSRLLLTSCHVTASVQHT